MAKEKEKQVIFQGTGYRILDNDKYNVILEIQNTEKRYSFVGYYTSIQKALAALIQRDLLINRHAKQDLQSYLKEIATYKRQVIADIESHFEANDDELFN